MTESNKSVTEQTPLLTNSRLDLNAKRDATPVPWLQVSILLLMRFAEPIAFMSIFPFVNQAIEKFEHLPASKVGFYSGTIESSFSFAQMFTILFWGRLSDRIGRKPVLLIGLLGSTVSITSFGFSRSFSMMLLSRCVCGILNGNVGVIKCALAELTDETNEAKVFALLSMAWPLGGALGPAIGGLLADPVKQYPGWFNNSPVFINYPYLLSCGFVALFPLTALILSLLFLQETLPKKVRSTHPEEDEAVSNHKAAPLKDLLTKRILSTLTNYAFLAFMTSCIAALVPLYLFTRIDMGGLGLSERDIGLAMSCQAVLVVASQSILFPAFHSFWGSVKLFRIMICMYPIAVLLFPWANTAARNNHRLVAIAIYAGTILCTSLGNMVYPANMLLINGAAPTRSALGTLNGLSQTCSSLVRSLGPVTSSSLFALSMQKHIAGGNLIWIFLFALTLCSVGTSWLLEDMPAAWRIQEQDESSEG